MVGNTSYKWDSETGQSGESNLGKLSSTTLSKNIKVYNMLLMVRGLSQTDLNRTVTIPLQAQQNLLSVYLNDSNNKK